jgi:ribose transport system substrate-binding protein
VPARTSAMTQAIALKPNAIILGGVDAKEQQPVIEQAAAEGIKIVGWHAGPQAGKVEGIPQVFYNVTTDPLEVAKASGLYAVVDSGGKAGVILFTDSIYAIATAKTNAEKAAIEGCSGCKVLSVEDTPIGDLANRMGQLTTSLLSKYGKAWTYSIAVNDLYFDFSAPSLVAANIEPASGYPRQISAGDGSVPAFQRIKQKQYQIATVAEPLHLQGWQLADELNRAFAGEQPSGYVPPVHLFTPDNIDKDGGAENIFDPGNGYKDQYKKIWGVK